MTEERPFLKSPLGWILCGFLAVAVFLLVAEHQAHIFAGNWAVWLLPLACVAMHFFHGHGHGSAPKHRHGSDPSGDRRREDG